MYAHTHMHTHLHSAVKNDQQDVQKIDSVNMCSCPHCSLFLINIYIFFCISTNI